MYQPLTLRMIRMLVALDRGWVLEHRPGIGYRWRPPAKGLARHEEAHWNTVVALCKRDLLEPIADSGGLVYHLTGKGYLYLQERAARQHADHSPL